MIFSGQKFKKFKKRNGRSGISARAGHRRSGNLGLWVRHKEQWADRRVMTADTRVRGLRRVSRSRGIRRSPAERLCSGGSPCSHLKSKNILGSEVAGTHFPAEIRQARHIRDKNSKNEK